MNQIKHFFRYEIPGYLSFIYVFIIVVSTLEKSIIVAYILPNIHSIALAGFLIAIPIGWIIYQGYDQINGFHCHKKTIKKVKGWFEDKYDKSLDKYLSERCNTKSEKKRCEMKEIYYQQAIDIGLYSKEETCSYHFELLINNLSNKYSSYESRKIVGKCVPFFSAAFLIIYCLFSYCCDFNFNIFNSISFCFYNSCRFWFIIVFALIIAAISISIYSHANSIKNAIQAQEDFLISVKKVQIENVFKSLLANKNHEKNHQIDIRT